MTGPSALPLALLAPPGDGMSPMIGFIVQIGLIFGIFYFLLLRPQQQQRKKHEEALRNIKRGDEVVTAGGIVGEVVHVRESSKDGQPQKSMEDRITIKSGESRLVVERGRIAKVVTPTTQTTAA
jgi:preprotein translocase subunit YajC